MNRESFLRERVLVMDNLLESLYWETFDKVLPRVWDIGLRGRYLVLLMDELVGFEMVRWSEYSVLVELGNKTRTGNREWVRSDLRSDVLIDVNVDLSIQW